MHDFVISYIVSQNSFPPSLPPPTNFHPDSYDVYTFTGDRNVCPIYVHVNETRALNSVQYMYPSWTHPSQGCRGTLYCLGFHRRKSRNGIFWWVLKEFHCNGDFQGARRDLQHGTHRSSSHIPANFCPFPCYRVSFRSVPFREIGTTDCSCCFSSIWREA